MVKREGSVGQEHNCCTCRLQFEVTVFTFHSLWASLGPTLGILEFLFSCTFFSTEILFYFPEEENSEQELNMKWSRAAAAAAADTSGDVDRRRKCLGGADIRWWVLASLSMSCLKAGWAAAE
jgi:hypothetical protein